MSCSACYPASSRWSYHNDRLSLHSDRESARRRRGRRPLRQADQSQGRPWASTGGDDTRRSGRSSVRRDLDYTIYGRRLNDLARRGGGPRVPHSCVGWSATQVQHSTLATSSSSTRTTACCGEFRRIELTLSFASFSTNSLNLGLGAECVQISNRSSAYWSAQMVVRPDRGSKR